MYIVVLISHKMSKPYQIMTATAVMKLPKIWWTGNDNLWPTPKKFTWSRKNLFAQVFCKLKYIFLLDLLCLCLNLKRICENTWICVSDLFTSFSSVARNVVHFKQSYSIFSFIYSYFMYHTQIVKAMLGITKNTGKWHKSAKLWWAYT